MSEQQPPPSPMPEGPSPAPPSEYEFNRDQNLVLAELAGNLAFTGWVTLLAVVGFHAVVLTRWAIQGEPPYPHFRLIQVLLPLLILWCSYQFIATGYAFRKVVDTQGSDIKHLMAGLGSLNDAFGWITLIPKIWLLIVAIGLVIGAIVGLIHWFGY
jgi:hypothetical protein